MTDRDLVLKKLAFIETCVRELETLARNILVHGYTAVDPSIVRDVVEHRLGDLLAFTRAMRARIADED